MLLSTGLIRSYHSSSVCMTHAQFTKKADLSFCLRFIWYEIMVWISHVLVIKICGLILLFPGNPLTDTIHIIPDQQKHELWLAMILVQRMHMLRYWHFNMLSNHQTHTQTVFIQHEYGKQTSRTRRQYQSRHILFCCIRHPNWQYSRISIHWHFH